MITNNNFGSNLVTILFPQFLFSFRRDSTASDTLVNMLLEELTKIHSNVEPSLFEDMLTIIWERIILPQFERHVAGRPAKIKNYYDILQVHLLLPH